MNKIPGFMPWSEYPSINNILLDYFEAELYLSVLLNIIR